MYLIRDGNDLYKWLKLKKIFIDWKIIFFNVIENVFYINKYVI